MVNVNGKTKAVAFTILQPPESAQTSPTPAPALPAQSVNAPVFIPKTPAARAGTPTPGPASPAPQGDLYQYSYDEHSVDTLADRLEAIQTTEPYDMLNQYQQPMMGYDGPSSDMFYTPQTTFVRQPLNYHLYTQPRPEHLQHRYFVSDDIREELTRRSETIHTGPAPGLGLPEELQGYHSLVPLEPVAGDRRKFGNWYSVVYRAINSKDGLTHVLRRIENYRLSHEAAFSYIEAWSRIRHPNVVAVKEAFTTRAFGDNSLVVVYEYHPNAQTLHEVHFKNPPPRRAPGPPVIDERTLWTYIIQIASAIKAVHEAGLALRVIDATKVLITSKNRVRISTCGVVDVLMYEAHQDIGYLQQEDYAMFGRLVVLLCNPMSRQMPMPSLDGLRMWYSEDMKNVAVLLNSRPDPTKAMAQLFELVGSRLLTDFAESQRAIDRFEGEFMSELENGRLVRLLCKFGFINERPEFGLDPRWSETGDKYIVKLFRDYVFHQVDEHGRPVVNLSHVLMCLNKLDAGSDERIMLVSRDEQSCLIVSYKDVKTCLESAFSLRRK
ncbi:hypothetical protein K474DRAFT_1063340 [Panus rudis PR-1116 ss-1]|nr:hypothetical protein K474DRAFT_1063340 [Panus rudis PR-1116 ss-1]